MGVSHNYGYLFGGSYNKDCSALGSILGSPYFGKLPYDFEEYGLPSLQPITLNPKPITLKPKPYVHGRSRNPSQAILPPGRWVGGQHPHGCKALAHMEWL